MRYFYGHGAAVSYAKKFKNVILLAVTGLFIFTQFAVIQNVGATQEWPTTDPDKISICHAASAVTNPYQANTVDLDAVDGSGGNDHSKHNDPVFNSSMEQGDD